MDGELGGLAVAQEVGAGDALAVNGQGDGAAHGGVLQQLVAQVEAQILQHGGRGVGVVRAQVGNGVVHAGELVAQQVHIPGREGVKHGLVALAGHEGDALQGHGFLLPPVVIGAQQPVPLVLGQVVGPGAQGMNGAGHIRPGDGNIQQGQELPVVPMEGDDHVVIPALHRLDLLQPGGVAVAKPGPAQGLGHVVGGEGGAVGKGDAPADGDGVGVRIGVVAGRLGQHGIGGKGVVQGIQPLVQQCPYRLGPAVGAGQGIQGLLRVPGQGEIGDGGGGGGLIFRLIVVCQLPERVGLHLIPIAAARQGQSQTKDQAKGNPSFHSVSSREMTAAWTPRRSPQRRWDQYRSG